MELIRRAALSCINDATYPQKAFYLSIRDMVTFLSVVLFIKELLQMRKVIMD